MDDLQELEEFLRDQRDDGVQVAEGQFTISREKALAKLSEFQLPFDGAWALKVIQFAVASGNTTAIRVTITRRQTQFQIEGEFSYTLEQFESALLDPEYKEDRALVHLIAALRVVGFRDKLGFWIESADEMQGLSWNGQALDTKPCKRKRQGLVLAVTNSSIEDEGGFFGFKGYKKVTERTSSITKVLTRMAHTCPVPLTIDGRRIDALELDPNHGWSPTSQLLIMGFQDGKPPAFKIPEGTTARVCNPDVPIESQLKVASKTTLERTARVETASVGYLLAAHTKRVKSGKSYRWIDCDEHSLCKWIQDGVVIQAEELHSQQESGSMGIFLNADDLQTDLTTFSLLSTTQKSDRLRSGVQLALEGFSEVNKLDFETMAQNAGNSNANAGIGFVVLGVGLMCFGQLQGILFAGIGVWSMGLGDGAARRKEQRIKDSLRRTKKILESRFV